MLLLLLLLLTARIHLFDLQWTIMLSIVLCVHRMRKGSDVVRGHLLTLHMIFFADGPLHHANQCHHFSTLSGHGKNFVCIRRTSIHTHGHKILFNNQQQNNRSSKEGKLAFFLSFLLLIGEGCVLLLPWQQDVSATPWQREMF